MSEVSQIFESVLLNLMDSFVPQIDPIFTKFDSDINKGTLTNAELDIFLQKTVLSFPKLVPSYQRTLDILAEFATSNPDKEDSELVKKMNTKVTIILNYLCNMFKTEANRLVDNDFTFLHIPSPNFRFSYFYHFQFLRCLSLIILSDIIENIYRRLPTAECINKMVQCAFHNCLAPHRMSMVQDRLIKTWSNVIYKISKTSILDLSQAFEQYVDESNSYLVLDLISRADTDDKFIESILEFIQQTKKHKALSSNILSSLSKVLSHANCKIELLHEFFKLAWSVKTADGVKDGAIDLITALYARIPEEAKKEAGFYSSRVIKHIGNPAKLLRTAKAFLRLIRGDISSVGYDQDNKLAYIGCVGKPYDQTPFPLLFMRNFFTKANFDACPDIFINIIIQIAAIDMTCFIKNVTPNFLKLPHTDKRYIIFLEAVTYINKKEFLEKAVCHPTEKMIADLNSLVRSSVVELVDEFEILAEKQERVGKCAENIISLIEECDQKVNEFISIKNYKKFEPANIELHASNIYDDSPTFLSALTESMMYVLNVDDFTHPQLMRGILLLSCAENLFLADIANQVIKRIYSVPEGQDIIIGACITNAQQKHQGVFETHCIAKIYELLNSSKCYLPDDTINELEALSLIALGWDSPVARYNAFNILKVISTFKEESVYEMLDINSNTICSAAKLSVAVLDTPKKPSSNIPPHGFIHFEVVCCSRYNTYWFLYYSACIETIIEYQNYVILDLIREMLYPNIICIERGEYKSEYNVWSMLLAFFDSFSADPDQEQVTLEDQYVEYYYKQIIHSKKVEISRMLMNITRFFNWRIINVLHPMITAFPHEIIEVAAGTIAYLIQIPNSFSHIMREAFSSFIDFLSLMQTYFTGIGINNTRKIIWNEKRLKVLNKHENIAVNYCIIISAVFNNIMDQISDDEWPLSTRQVLVQYLYHWCRLPESEEKIRAYAINALIPILKSGVIFTDGFQFELPMLKIMVEKQVEGYDVLSSVLIYHFDIMFDIFVRQVFIRTKLESRMFFEAVLSSLSVFNDKSVMKDHLGSLLLLTQFWGMDDPEPTKPILKSISEAFIEESKESVEEIIDKANDLNFVPVMFNFATEQVIEAGLEIIKSTKLVSTVRTVVSLLVPWYAPIRVLPINKNIMQGIPEGFRRFNIVSFLTAMSEVAKSVNGEQNEVFSQLWYELLRFKDNSVVVLLCLFEIDDVTIKERVFSQLIEKEPELVTKYLSKRCSFSFWYFTVTEKKSNVDSILWMLNTLTQAYTTYVDPNDLEDLHFTTVIHFCLIFIEKTYPYFEKLISVFGPEYTDSVLQYAPDMEGGNIKISQVTSKLAECLHEICPTTLEKWATEAFKWGVCCNEVKVATRSLAVFNALRGEFQSSYVQLICDAISFHIKGANPDDYNDLIEYIGECFDTFYNNIECHDVSKVAFEIASEFLDFNDGNNKFIKRALPIFKYSSQDPNISSEAKEVLIKAFAPSLETDTEAQNLLGYIIQSTNAPEALLVAAPFIKHNLSFVDIHKTYDEIMAVPFDSLHAKNVLLMYNDMIKTGSQQLISAIIDVSTEFVRRFKDCIAPSVLNPIYQVALTKIAMFRSAVDFVMYISIACPNVSTYNNQMEAEYVSKSFGSIMKKISMITSESINPVPITNCKNITQLRGIISQKSPPKITPYSSQHEMFVDLQRTESPTARVSTRKLTTQLSTLRSLPLINKASVTPSMVSKTTNDKSVYIKKLPEPVIQGAFCSNDKDKRETKIREQFLLSIEEFSLLDE